MQFCAILATFDTGTVEYDEERVVRHGHIIGHKEEDKLVPVRYSITYSGKLDAKEHKEVAGSFEKSLQKAVDDYAERAEAVERADFEILPRVEYKGMYAIHPSYILNHLIYGWGHNFTYNEDGGYPHNFAEDSGLTEDELRLFLEAKIDVTPDMAIIIGAATNTKPAYWLALQRKFDEKIEYFLAIQPAYAGKKKDKNKEESNENGRPLYSCLYAAD